MHRNRLLFPLWILLGSCSLPPESAPPIEEPSAATLKEAPSESESRKTPRPSDPAHRELPSPDGLEALARELFETFVGQAQLEPEDVFLSEAEVRSFYNPAFAKIVLPSWASQNQAAWRHFSKELNESNAVLERIEVDEPEFYGLGDRRPGNTLIRDATIIHEARITYSQGTERRTLVLKTCVHTDRGWRAMQLEPRAARNP